MFSCCELARYFDAMPMGVCVIGADGKGLYSNQAAIHILGRPMEARPESGALGRVCGFFLAGTDKVYPVEKTPFYLIVHKGLASHTIADMEVEHPGAGAFSWKSRPARSPTIKAPWCRS